MRISDTPEPDPAGDGQEAVPEVAAGLRNDSAVNPEPGDASAEPAALVGRNALEAPESKILELRAQYLDRTYKIDAKELSSRIIDEHLRK